MPRSKMPDTSSQAVKVRLEEDLTAWVWPAMIRVDVPSSSDLEQQHSVFLVAGASPDRCAMGVPVACRSAEIPGRA
jgi:hypothetical protein